MRRLGRVLHVSKDRNIILKVESLPRIGQAVVNKELKPVGKVLDIFGPVTSPYAAVAPESHGAKTPANASLYILPPKRERRIHR